MDESTKLDQSIWFEKKSTLKLLPLIIVSILCSILFLPFCGAVLLGAVFALALNPYVKQIKKKGGHFFKSAHVIVFIAFIFLLVLPIGLFSAKFYAFLSQPAENGVESMSYFSNSKEVSARFVSPFLNKMQIQPSVALQNWIELQISNASNYILKLVEKSITEIPQLSFLFFIFLISLYYFMSEGLRIKYWFLRSKIFSYRKAQSFNKLS
jgi:predicted PurR-regulated permease PerM